MGHKAASTPAASTTNRHLDSSLGTSPQSRQSSNQSHRHGDEGDEVREGSREGYRPVRPHEAD